MDAITEQFEQIKISTIECENMTGKKKETMKAKLLFKETKFIESLIETNNLEAIAHFINQNLDDDLKGFTFDHLLHIMFSSDSITPNDRKQFISNWINKYSMDDYQLEQFICIAKEYCDLGVEHMVKMLNVKLGLNFLHNQYHDLMKEISSEEIQELHSVIRQSDFIQVLSDIQETTPQLVKKQKAVKKITKKNDETK